MSVLRAVLFDMDGVITDSMPYHYRAWHKTLHDEDIPVTAYDIFQREGQKGIASVSELFAKYHKPLSLRQAKKILAKKEALFRQIIHTKFISGSRPFIRMLSSKNIRLALVTGTSRQEVCRILPKHLLGCFSVIVSGSDVQHGKPHPEPYLKAWERLSIPKGEAVVVENAPLGIRSAKSAGLKCLAIETSLPRKYLQGADCVFGDFRSLREYFQISYKI